MTPEEFVPGYVRSNPSVSFAYDGKHSYTMSIMEFRGGGHDRCESQERDWKSAWQTQRDCKVSFEIVLFSKDGIDG